MVKTAMIYGVDSKIIDIEVEIFNGLPSLTIVGLPAQSIRESRERVRSAIINSGFKFPKGRIVVNLSPSNIRKSGTMLDLPIAIAILAKSSQISSKILDDILIFGELSLNGELRGIQGAIALTMASLESGIRRVLLPNGNGLEASMIREVDVYGFDSLLEVTNFLYAVNKEPYKKDQSLMEEEFNIDFDEVYSSKQALRSIEIAIGGRHNFLLWGSPGSGKSMISDRIKTILPGLTTKEAIEVAKINSIKGNNFDLKINPPFRSPHPTTTLAGMFGGTSNLVPGEISLASNGVLYLDEVLEFNNKVIENLRGPLQDREVCISKGIKSAKLPCDFILALSTNPCKCGFYNTGEGYCTCGEWKANKYLSKLSGPILDRIDMYMQCRKIDSSKLTVYKTSKEMRETVIEIRNIQEDRYKKFKISGRDDIDIKVLEEFCKMNPRLLKEFKEKFISMGVSNRGMKKIFGVARTIADYNKAKEVKSSEIIEAINYRRFVNGEVI